MNAMNAMNASNDNAKQAPPWSPRVPSFELLALARCRGGFTYGCKTGAVYGNGTGCRKLTGWAVAMSGRECRLVMPNQELPEPLYKVHRAAVEAMMDGYVKANVDMLGNRDCYLGGWVHDDHLFLDCAYWVASRNEAMTLGLAWGQVEVFDFENDKSVPVEDEDVSE
jgi:hypothetical protein